MQANIQQPQQYFHSLRAVLALLTVLAFIGALFSSQLVYADSALLKVETSAASAQPAHPTAEKVEPKFNLNFIRGGNGVSSDAAKLLGSADNEVLPGVYQVDIWLNDTLISRRPVSFDANPSSKKIEACIDPALFKLLNINTSVLKQSAEALAEQKCLDLPTIIEHASMRYDAASLRLSISIPQASLLTSAQNYVDPALWDSGVTAAYINYNINASYGWANAGNSSKSLNIGMNNGFNLAGWRLRNDANFSANNGSNDFRSNRTYIERDIDSLRSQLSLGDQYTDGTLFDSVRYRGVKLVTDDGMFPSNELGYAPVVRGQAASIATVEVRQNGYVLYKTTVPPGPFALKDISPSGSNGDLEITVTEADNTKHVTYQSFSNLPIMVRKDRFKYAFSAGQYLSTYGNSDKGIITSANAVYGIADNTTLAGGVVFAAGYQAANIGFGANTWIGALSLDVTHSRSQINQNSYNGQSFRILYSKLFAYTNTNFTIAAYRYSTEGYRSLSEHLGERASLSNGSTYNQYGRTRSRIDFTTSQELGENRRFGSLYINLTQQTYWGQSGSTRYVSAGYSNSIGAMSYSINFAQTKDNRDTLASGQTNSTKQVQLSVSFPLGTGRNLPRFSNATTHDQTNGMQLRNSLSGQFGENSSYSVNMGYSDQSKTTSLGASMSTSTDLFGLSSSYSYSKGYQSVSAGASGALVLHSGGLNMSRSLGDGFAILQSKGIKDSKLAVQGGGSFGANGYAIMPSLAPYRVNTISLDTRQVDSSVELEITTQQVVPRRGAIVKAEYQGFSGRRIQFRLLQENGEMVPFGSLIKDQNQQVLGFADPNGKALVLLRQDSGTLTADIRGQTCQAAFSLPPADKNLNYQKMDVVCKMQPKSGENLE